jgi:S-adenosylmethionine/arginine decarboxylase-like enzyme
MSEENTVELQEESSVKPWGFHFILDCVGANHESITSAENITAFAKKLVKDIDMVAYGEPQVVRFGSGDKQGYTLVQLIETSNICAHFVEENDTFYLDVFSCKPFDVNVVIDLAIEFFKITSYKQAYLERKA